MDDKPDVPGLVGGACVVVLGFLLLLDRAEVLHLGFGWLWPAILATIGAYLLASGLSRPRDYRHHHRHGLRRAARAVSVSVSVAASPPPIRWAAHGGRRRAARARRPARRPPARAALRQRRRLAGRPRRGRRGAHLAPVRRPRPGSARCRGRARPRRPGNGVAAGSRPRTPAGARSELANLYRGGFGIALVVGRGAALPLANDALGATRDAALTAVVVIVALGLVLAPFLWRLGRNLAAERAARIRSRSAPSSPPTSTTRSSRR